MPLGSAVKTTAGRLPFRAIIHVAGINLVWRASEASIRGSVRNAMQIVDVDGYKSVAFPVIGAGAGNFGTEGALGFMLDELEGIETGARVVIVIFDPRSARNA